MCIARKRKVVTLIAYKWIALYVIYLSKNKKHYSIPKVWEFYMPFCLKMSSKIITKFNFLTIAISKYGLISAFQYFKALLKRNIAYRNKMLLSLVLNLKII